MKEILKVWDLIYSGKHRVDFGFRSSLNLEQKVWEGGSGWWGLELSKAWKETFLMYKLLKLAHQKFHYPDVETSERKDLSKA